MASVDSGEHPDEMEALIVDAIPPLMDAVDAMKSAEVELNKENLQLMFSMRLP